METYRFRTIIQKDEDGYYASCPELPGCFSSADTHDEIKANIAEAIRLYIEHCLEHGDEIPKPSEVVELDTIELAV